MHRLTHAYKVWKHAPQDVYEATTPEDFAKGWEVWFFKVDGNVSHFFQHVKQWLWFKFNLFPGSMKIENHCTCSQFKKLGI